MIQGPRRVLYLALAGIFFLLAALGVLLPGLPTTPFLLLTSFFLIRSSPALNDKLLQSGTFGPMLEDWNRHRAVRPRVKRITIVATLAVVSVSILLADRQPVLIGVIALAALVGLVVVARLPVINED